MHVIFGGYVCPSPRVLPNKAVYLSSSCNSLFCCWGVRWLQSSWLTFCKFSFFVHRPIAHFVASHVLAGPQCSSNCRWIDVWSVKRVAATLLNVHWSRVRDRALASRITPRLAQVSGPKNQVIGRMCIFCWNIDNIGPKVHNFRLWKFRGYHI